VTSSLIFRTFEFLDNKSLIPSAFTDKLNEKKRATRNEKRTAEKIGQKLMKSIKAIIPSKYKPVEARIVANAMKEAVKRPRSGKQVYHYREMMELQTTKET